MTDFPTVKQAVDLVAYIESRGLHLKKSGHDYKALCPFHAEKSPSFVVNPETQRWQCFGACGTGGDVFEFVEKYDHVDTGEALRIVAEYARIDLGKPEESHKRLYDLLELATQTYHHHLLHSNDGKPVERYLRSERKLSLEMIFNAQIGYAAKAGIRAVLGNKGYTDQEMLDAGILAKSDDGRLYEAFRNRIMIPIMDQQGRVIGFNGRAMVNDQPKYKNTAETALFKKSKILYTLREKNTQGKALDPVKVKTIVEGPFDALSGLMRGFRGIYAQMGSALSLDQLTTLARGGTETIIFCFDNDQAGEGMMRRLAKEHLHSAAKLGVELRIMRPPYGKDADDTFREHAELWQAAVDAAQPVVSVLIDLELASMGSNPTAAQVSSMINDLLPILKSNNPLIEDENIRILSSKTGVAFDRLKNWLAPQLVVIGKPTLAPKQDDSPLPTDAEWVLHGILMHEADGWLKRANACLLIASDSPMPYALAPLNGSDFTDAKLRRFFEIAAKAQAEETMIGTLIDPALEATYARIKGLGEIGAQFGLSFDYQVFIGRVYVLRLARLRKERPTYEGKDDAKARECAMAIACLQMEFEDLEA